VTTRFGIEKALGLTDSFGTHECKMYRERIFKAHEFIAMPLAKNYVKTAKSKSYVEANLELGSFHQRLKIGERFEELYLDSSDDDIKQFADRKSLMIDGLFHRHAKRVGFRKATKIIIKKVQSFGLKFPLDNPSKANDEDYARGIARCSDPAWWRRQIHKLQSYILEHILIQIGSVNRNSGIYASNITVNRKRKQWKRNAEILASLEAENDLGQVFNLLDLAKRSVSNPTIRRNELMTRLAGFEGYAKDIGDCGLFITLTAPSKYHKQLSQPCIPNPKYEGASPKDTQEYFNNNWKLMRASLNHKNIQPYGFRVVEPHHDGTPHWHLLLFMKPSEISIVTEVIRKYALAESPAETGAQLRRVTVEKIDPKKGSAVGYIAKYISKNIDGEHVGADHYGFDAVESATRIRAWASNWSIRQFQSIGGPSVTAWRLVRGFASSAAAEETLQRIGSEHLKELVDAADKGNWQAFIKSSGGATIPRKDQPLRALHVKKESPNKYGEKIKKIIGFCFKGIEKIVTKIRVWTVRPVNVVKEINCFGLGFALGGANAPPLEFCQ
jgi:Bacteriophage replication gene A protein (GPA)